MKSSGKIEVIMATPLVAVGVTIAKPSLKIPSAPYAVVSQVQLTIVKLIQKKKDT